MSNKFSDLQGVSMETGKRDSKYVQDEKDMYKYIHKDIDKYRHIYW